jgi:hypothetical protein
MAAVLALVFLFALASIALMIKITVGGATVATVFAMTCFVALAAGVFIGAFMQVRRWENDE